MRSRSALASTVSVGSRGGFGVWSGRSGLVWSVSPPLVAGRLRHAVHALWPVRGPAFLALTLSRATVACQYSVGCCVGCSPPRGSSAPTHDAPLFVLPEGGNSALSFDWLLSAMNFRERAFEVACWMFFLHARLPGQCR